MKSRASLIPIPRYRDARAAIEWLCAAFGFEKKLVVEGDDGSIKHSQLALDGSLMMVGQASEPDALRPATIAYVIIDDADALHDRVVAAGGKIIHPLTDQPYGGRDFGCLDLEGNTWHFGTYDPFVATEG